MAKGLDDRAFSALAAVHGQAVEEHIRCCFSSLSIGRYTDPMVIKEKKRRSRLSSVFFDKFHRLNKDCKLAWRLMPRLGFLGLAVLGLYPSLGSLFHRPSFSLTSTISHTRKLRGVPENHFFNNVGKTAPLKQPADLVKHAITSKEILLLSSSSLFLYPKPPCYVIPSNSSFFLAACLFFFVCVFGG